MNDKHINDGGPAFPEVRIRAGDNYNAPVKLYYRGMTLRDYFAAKAMQSMLLDTKQFAGCGLGGPSLAAVPDIIAGWSYLMADAMLKAREASND